MQLGWPLPLVLDTYAKWALETLSGVDDGLGNLTLSYRRILVTGGVRRQRFEFAI